MSANASAKIDRLLAYRDRFPILERTNYLINNSLGAMPALVHESLARYADQWAGRGVRAWEEEWWTLAADLGNLVAPLIGAGEGEVVFQPCVTLAHSIIFSACDFSVKKNRVVTDAMHFPSILYAIHELQRQGAEVTVVPCEDGIGVDLERIVNAIDDRTAIVNLSHVYFKTAYLQDIIPIARRAREVGALSVIDGYQAVGTVPVDVRELGCDVYIGGCLKWLCGGPGNAFLWVDPRIRGELHPRITGWMSHKRPFDFSIELDQCEDGWRFLSGTPSIPSLYAAKPGLEIIRQMGVAAIREKSIVQTQRIFERASELGFRCMASPSPTLRGGTVAIDIPNGYEVSRALKAREILCDYRPGAGIRLSPHFYNRDDEIEEALDSLDSIVRDGTWRAFSGEHSAVT